MMIRNKEEFIRKHNQNMIKSVCRSETKINDNLFSIRMHVMPHCNKLMLKNLLIKLGITGIIKINTSNKTKHVKATIWPTQQKQKSAIVFLNKSFNEYLNQWQQNYMPQNK